MARLTEAKMTRWSKDIVKATTITNKVRYEVMDVSNSAKGGRLESISRLQDALLEAGQELSNCIEKLNALAEREKNVRSWTE